MKRLMQLASVMCLLMGASNVQAQWAVTDPGNLIQNTSTAISTAEQVRQQIQAVQYQMQMLENMVKNTKNLSAQDYNSMRNSFYQLQGNYHQMRYVGVHWGQVADQYEQVYTKYKPTDDESAYKEKREKWEGQTDESIRVAMESHGVLDSYDERERSIENVYLQAEGAEGVLQALKVGNRISVLMLKQLKELSEIIVLDSRARLSHIKEQQMKKQASRERTRKVNADWGKKSSSRQARTSLPEIK